MQDDTWIRTYGNKSFYHDSGTMRTDGVFEVGPSGNRFRVMPNGNVGVGITNPSEELDVNGQVQSRGIILLDGTYGGNSDFTALYREDIGNDNATVKFRIGDDILGSFQIGYTYWSTGEWVSRFYVNNNGNVGIGTTKPTHKLAVNGIIRAKEVIVETGWSDYVFEEDYVLAPLSEVEAHIEENGHLPGIPSASEIEANGAKLSELVTLQMAKIEELTLYLIEKEKQLDSANEIIERQSRQLASIFLRLEAIEN